MGKMLWELQLPFEIAKAKEDLSKNNIWKYLRYFKMYMSRFRVYSEKTDLSYDLFSKLLFRGMCAIVNDSVYGTVIAEIDETKTKVDASGKPTHITVSYDNKTIRKDLELGKQAVIVYADETHIPPVLYIWAIANEILVREDIIRQQDNMLRKPIVIAGEGEDFDNAVNNATNILSGIEWINTKKKGGSKQAKNIMSDKEIQVLNLQVGNAYKGMELWASRKNFEELICDYLGFTTTKNEKRERMNTLEVKNENSVGQTFYKSSVKCLEDAIEEYAKIGEKLRFEKLLDEQKEETKEVINNGNNETNVE